MWTPTSIHVTETDQDNEFEAREKLDAGLQTALDLEPHVNQNAQASP